MAVFCCALFTLVALLDLQLPELQNQAPSEFWTWTSRMMHSTCMCWSVLRLCWRCIIMIQALLPKSKDTETNAEKGPFSQMKILIVGTERKAEVMMITSPRTHTDNLEKISTFRNFGSLRIEWPLDEFLPHDCAECIGNNRHKLDQGK